MGKNKSTDNYCEICGKLTAEVKALGKASDPYPNQFFICKKCEKVWCAGCMKSIVRKTHKETHRLGKKKQISCPECKQKIPMVRAPKNIGFKQKKVRKKKKLTKKISDEFDLAGTDVEGVAYDARKKCKNCGGAIARHLNICPKCGAQQ